MRGTPIRLSTFVCLLCLPVACGSPDGSDDSSATLTSASASTTTTTDSTSETGTTQGETDSTESTDSTDSTDSLTTGPVLDIGGATGETTGGDCLQCSLSVSSQQSGVLDLDGAEVIGTAELMNEIVYVMGTYGAGRFIAVADSSLPMNEESDCPIHPWLAGSSVVDPPMLVFGWAEGEGTNPDNPTWAGPNQTSSNIHMPAQYIGDPAALANDFDIVLYLESSHQYDEGDEPTDEEMQTLLDYVNIHGGGLYISGEFANPDGFYLNAIDLASVNRLFNPIGLNQPELSLNWGDVSGDIDFECFPPVD